MSAGNRPLLDAAAGIAVLTALLYTLGWSYAYTFFDRLNLGLLSLNLPTEYLLMTGFRVVRDYLGWLLAVLALTAPLGVYRRAWLQQAAGLLRNWALPLGLLVFVLAYVLAGHSARSDLAGHHAQGFDRYPWTRVWLLTEAGKSDPIPARIREDLREGRYRLLLQTSSGVVLIKPKAGAAIPALHVPWAQVALIRRLPVNPP